MSEPIELNDSLDEQSRQAYLSAMQLEQWVPLSEIAISETESGSAMLGDQKSVHIIVPATVATELEKADDDSKSNPHELSHSEARVIKSKNLESRDASPDNIDAAEAKKSHSEQQVEETSLSGRASENLDSDILANNNQSSHFLKQVSWSNRVLSEDNAKSLMIVCRHMVDQPANSFARSNSPSQFMMDYINALNHFSANQNFELAIQLAHLSAAGLSDDSVPLSQAILNNRPKLMIILGEETVSHLLGKSMEVATCRGQIKKLEDGTNVLVSYHPYSLIKNPSLKRLAFEDIAMASEFLANNN